MPTLRATLGVKGHRPVVGSWDNKAQVYTFAALNVVDASLTTRLLDNPSRATQTTGKSKTRRLQEAFAAHLRDIARRYPCETCPRVVIVIDNAPWHRGALMNAVLAEHPHLELYRLPSYSPQLNVVERLWKVLRRRATHNRLFDTAEDLKQALRGSLRYYQTMRHKLMTLIKSPRKAAKVGAV